MTSYNLNALGDSEFEQLFQSLLKKVIGVGTITFGPGPDGAREATYEGPANYPSSTNRWSGNWIFQAKFHNTDNNLFGQRKQILQDLKNELSKITRKYKRPCDNYILGTNVPLSAAADTGTLDKIRTIAQEFRQTVPNIDVWGYDDICRFIENYEDIRKAFLHFILPGDVLSKLISQNIDRHFEKLKKKVIAPIMKYLNQYPSELPTIDQVRSNVMNPWTFSMSAGFDPVLVDDFIDNHYLRIKTLWNNMCEYNSKVNEKWTSIAKIIDKNLRNALKDKAYSYLYDNTRYYHLCIEEFENTLIDSILDCRVPCSHIHEDPSQKGRIKFIHRNIYMLNDDDDSSETISKLKILCRRIAYNKRIMAHINGQDGYKALKEGRQEILKVFRKELGIINNSETLTVLKNIDHTPKCPLL